MKEIQFRKLAKSGNFDIIVAEGRFEIEVLPNKAGIKSIIGSDGYRRSVNRSDIYLKYRKEINDYYYGDKYAKGSTVPSKKKQPKIVRGFSDDEEYEYGQGGTTKGFNYTIGGL